MTPATSPPVGAGRPGSGPRGPGFAWTDATVRDALGLPARGRGGPALAFPRVCTDTRTAGPGELFVALVGDRFDGHDFLGEAASRRVGGAIVSKDVSKQVPDAVAALPLYRVDDTLDALGRLARYRRRALPARVVAVTGSSGKTSVKDLLAASLSGAYRVHATTGNENNRVGVPLTLLSAPADAELLVVEIGTSVPGEIATLTAVTEPDAAVVTTVSEAHLAGLGSFEGVLEEKLALVRGAPADATVLVGDAPPELPTRARGLRPGVRVAGISDRSDEDLRGELGESDARGRYRVRVWNGTVVSPFPGKHGAQNLVLALAMAKLLGADFRSAVEGLAGVEARKMRNEVRTIGDLTLLLDCYNANPQSTVAALDLLADLPATSGRVAVLASMLELGDRSAALHRSVLDHALSLPVDLVVAVGEFASAVRELDARHPDGPALLRVDSPEEAFEALRPRLDGRETVLLKGSRGMRLERLVPRFEAAFGAKSTAEDEGA